MKSGAYKRKHEGFVSCPSPAPICADCVPKHPCPQNAVFSCCTGAGLQDIRACPTTPLSLVCATIDTTCLCKPYVQLDYSAMITTEIMVDVGPSLIDGGVTFVLTFQVKKRCDNGQSIECGNWTFTKSISSGTNTIVALTTGDAFKFRFCDCNPCPACCIYSVDLVSCEVSEFGDVDSSMIRFGISAPTVTLLATDTCPQ